MNVEYAIRSICHLLQALDKEPSVRAVADILQHANGSAVRWAVIRDGIAKFKKGNRQFAADRPSEKFDHNEQFAADRDEENIQQSPETGDKHLPATLGQQSGNGGSYHGNGSTLTGQQLESSGQRTGNLHARVAKENNLNISSPATQAQPLENSRGRAATSDARQLRLPDPDEERARAILATIWPSVQPSVVGSMTKTEWGKRNKRFALDMAQAGVTPDRALAAHAAASQRIGETVRSLQIVQDQLARGTEPLKQTKRGVHGDGYRAQQFSAPDELAEYARQIEIAAGLRKE